MADGLTRFGTENAKQQQNELIIKLTSFKQAYDIKNEIGRGAYSFVYRCVQISTGLEFAAKIISMKRTKKNENEKIEKEARICRMLKHPNIVQIHEVIKDDSFYVLIFDLITGGELFVDLVTRLSYSEVDASHCIGQVLEAISYCHRLGIIHRDLKPENLLLVSKSRNGDIKVADFGLAQEVKGDAIAWYGFYGTPGYISPEMLKRQPYGKPVDMWSIGNILYALLVGYLPFYHENDDKHYELVKLGKYSFPSPEWDSVSKEAKSLVEGMLVNDQSQRISAEEALKHPWITNRHEVASSMHRSETIEKLKSFNARRRLKAAILTTMVAASFRSALGRSTSGSTDDIQKNEKLAVPQKAPSSSPTGSVAPNSAVKTDKKENTDVINSTARRQEIVKLTEKILWAIDNGNFDVYMKMIVPYVTTFDPDAYGELVQGVDFHRAQFLRVSKNRKVLGTKIMNPYVHLLGPDAACIAYTRITQFVDRDGIKQLQHSEESRLWQKQNNVWLNVHVHRSAYLPELWTRSSVSISDRQKKRPSFDKQISEQ